MLWWVYREASRMQGRLLIRTGMSERGAALVEFALVLPILMILLIGTVTTGLALNSTISLNNAAREGGRFGATLPDENLAVWLNSVADVAQGAATGDLADGVDGRTICVAYLYPNGTIPAIDFGDIAGSMTTDHTARLIINSAGQKFYTIGSSCYTDGRPGSERRVQVSVERDVDLDFVFTQVTMTIDGRSTARFERTE